MKIKKGNESQRSSLRRAKPHYKRTGTKSEGLKNNRFLIAAHKDHYSYAALIAIIAPTILVLSAQLESHP